MKMFIEGPQSVNGSVRVSGAKNSATRILAGALLSSGNVRLRNFPVHLEDVKAKISFMQQLGATVITNDNASELEVEVSELSSDNITDFALPIRTTYLLAAGTLIRKGSAKIPYPGGCKIGARGYDLHVMVWERFGCSVVEKPDYLEVSGQLHGCEIDFPISTVGGTENSLLCAAVAEGDTTIRNAYVTPEVKDLIKFLCEMGARISTDGTSVIRVKGIGGLLNGASYSIMPDRIEALTWMILASITKGDLLIENVPFLDMEVPLIHLNHAGVDYFRNSGTAHVAPSSIGRSGLQPFELATGTHPGVISDMQSFFVVLAMFSQGRSNVFDYRYPERIAYASELEKFAPGSMQVNPGRITINGGSRLVGCEVDSTDLRGSMAVIMAAICSEGRSCVNGVELALRGYNDLDKKLASVGVKAEWMD